MGSAARTCRCTLLIGGGGARALARYRPDNRHSFVGSSKKKHTHFLLPFLLLLLLLLLLLPLE